MKKIILIIIILALCIYLCNNEEKYPEIISEINNIPPTMTPTINDIYNKHWDIRNTSFSLLENRPVANNPPNKEKFTLPPSLEFTNESASTNSVNVNGSNFKAVNLGPTINISSVDKTENNPPKNFTHNNLEYNIFGTASNKNYNQYYIVYERLYDNYNGLNEEFQYYEYILVKLIYNKYIIMHIIQPRKKIEIGEYINFSYGAININPLLVESI